MRVAALALLVSVAPVVAQEAGWHYSPYPGEGDRAALGCAYGASPQSHACVAVRCEDDFSVGLHIDTTRPGGDAGPWLIQVDKELFEVDAVAVEGSPYGSRVAGDVAPIIESMKHGDSLFVDPRSAGEPPSRGIGLSGSMRAINQALFFCAPRAAAEPDAASTTD